MYGYSILILDSSKKKGELRISEYWINAIQPKLILLPFDILSRKKTRNPPFHQISPIDQFLFYFIFFEHVLDHSIIYCCTIFRFDSKNFILNQLPRKLLLIIMWRFVSAFTFTFSVVFFSSFSFHSYFGVNWISSTFWCYFPWIIIY